MHDDPRRVSSWSADHRPHIDLEPVPAAGSILPGIVPGIDRNYGFTTSLVAALASLGVGHAAIAPGSRSTPLALTLASNKSIRDWPHHDERSAAFFALGVSKATRTPAVVACTSGTAVTELFPALTEARYGRVPLIAVTADRPSELLGTGAPQMIDQGGIFGPTVKWSRDLDIPDPADVPAGYPASLAAQMVAAALDGPPGPVHLNLRFREPLVPTGEAATGDHDPPLLRRGRVAVDADAVRRLAALIGGRRTVVVCGPQDDPMLPTAVTGWATEAEVPIVADPLSGLRAGPHDRSRVVATGDALARARFFDRARPEVVIRVGALPTSAAIWSWLGANLDVTQVLIDEGGWRDPTRSISTAVRADPATVFGDLAAVVDPAPDGWAERWAGADRAAAEALRDAVAALPFPSEPAVARVIADTLPDNSILHVASSMPVRDIDAVFPSTERPIRVTSNRGANGIDGFLSSGLGMASAAVGPTFLLAGDLSALHDLTALGVASRLEIPIAIVVVNNDGGGIFHFLPQSGFDETTFERHWGTPHGLDFVKAAELFGVAARRVDDRDGLREAVAEPPRGPELIEIKTDRRGNVELHARLRRAVEGAVEGL